MRLKRKNGFSMVELIIVVVLLGIFIVPITNMVIQLININSKNIKLKDATYLAQKYCEIIEAQDAGAAGFTLPDANINSFAEITESLNGNTYTARCTRLKNDAITSTTNSFANEHLVLNISGTNLSVGTEKLSGGAFSTTSFSTYDIGSDDYSIIIKDGAASPNKAIEIYKNEQYPSDPNDPSIIKKEFLKPDGSSNPCFVITGDSSKLSDNASSPDLTITNAYNVLKLIRIACSNVSGTSHVNIYNNTSGTGIKIYYDSNQTTSTPPAVPRMGLHPKYDNITGSNNIIMYDIKGINESYLYGTTTSQTYEIKIWEQGATAGDPLIQRKVTTVQ
ncbi:MAG: type IV pilus modification PilV family protein [Ignavibacteriales bacterium]